MQKKGLLLPDWKIVLPLIYTDVSIRGDIIITCDGKKSEFIKIKRK